MIKIKRMTHNLLVIVQLNCNIFNLAFKEFFYCEFTNLTIQIGMTRIHCVFQIIVICIVIKK